MMSLITVDWNCTAALMETPPGSQRARFSYIANVYYIIVVVIALINILANSFSFHIFRKPIWKRSLVSILLKVLSLFEILFQINVFLSAVFGLIDRSFGLPTMLIAYVFHYTLKVANLLSLTFQMARNWTVVMLAAYRYEVICRPLSATKVFTATSMTRVVLIPVVIGLALSLPRFFESGIILCPEIWRKAFRSPIFTIYPWYNYFYIGFVMFLGQSGGPVISVCVLSFFVVRVIWNRRQFRKSQNIRERTPSTGDKLVLILCCTFFIFETPAFFSKILYTPLNLAGYNMTNLYLGFCGNILIYLDSMINVFIYMGSNPTFREATANQLKMCGLDITKWNSKETTQNVNGDEELQPLKNKKQTVTAELV